MIIAVFRARVNDSAQDEFNSLYAEMGDIVSKMSGYISHKAFGAEDGEAVVIAEFEDMETVEEWDVHPDHKRAKQKGKDYIFDAYDVAVARIVERHTKP